MRFAFGGSLGGATSGERAIGAGAAADTGVGASDTRTSAGAAEVAARRTFADPGRGRVRSPTASAPVKARIPAPTIVHRRDQITVRLDAVAVGGSLAGGAETLSGISEDFGWT